MITLQTPKYRVLLTEAAQALISRENQVRQVGEVCTPSRWGRMVWPLCEVLLRRPPPGLEIADMIGDPAAWTSIDRTEEP